MVASVNPAANSLVNVYEELANSLVDDEQQASERLLSALLRITNGAGALVKIESEAEPSIYRMISKQAYQWMPKLDVTLERLVEAAQDQPRVVLRCLDQQLNLHGLALTSRFKSMHCTTVLLLVCESSKIAPFVSLFESVCAFQLASLSGKTRSGDEVGQQKIAATLQLVVNALKSDSSTNVAHQILHDLSAELKADFAVYSTARSPKSTIMISRVADNDKRSEFSDCALEVFQSVWESKDDSLEWSIGTSHQSDVFNRAARSLARILNVERIECFRCSDPEDNNQLAMLFIWHHDDGVDDERAWINAALQTLSPLLSGKFQPRKRRFFQVLFDYRARAVVATLMVILLSMFVPIPYEVTSDVTVQPKIRRYVAAPLNGVLEKTLVRPGDKVSRDAVLATMDKSELTLEIEAQSAELERTQKIRDRALANGDRGATRLAELEIEKLASKLALLENQLTQLRLLSPLDGIVLTGDLERVEGAPVKRGDKLFEVAPLDGLRFEIDIPHDDIDLVSINSNTTVSLRPMPDRQWQGRINRIYPRSITVDQETIFRAEMFIKNVDGSLKPGMLGKAEIDAGSRAIGWVIFHKPISRIRYWLGW